jgi:hypothetical protein
MEGRSRQRRDGAAKAVHNIARLKRWRMPLVICSGQAAAANAAIRFLPRCLFVPAADATVVVCLLESWAAFLDQIPS